MGRSWRSRPQAERPSPPPLLVSHHERNTQRIVALDERAETLRLKRGMGLADARAMYPGAEIVEADPQADRRLLEGLADWCDRYTPLVAIDGADGLFLDISGCAHLFGGERALLEDAGRRFLQQGFDVRAGLASTPGAAWAAAHFLAPVPEELERAFGQGRPGEICPSILDEGREAEALAPLPLSALRLDPAVRAGLESVGLRTVGALLSAPRAPLARRFGAMLLVRLDQALGRVEEAVSPRLPVAPLSVERHLAEPVILMEDIERLVVLLTASLKPDLERRGEGARTLELLLFRVDGAVRRIAVGASRPLREPALVQRLFHERLAALENGLDADCGFELVRLSAALLAPFEMAQADLHGDADDGGDTLALLADRIRARLGDDALLAPVPAQSHIPERAVANLPFAKQPTRGKAVPAAAVAEAAPERPIRLFASPEPVEVMAVEVPEGPPLRFRWRRVLHQVARSEGPERIAPEWWHDRADAPTRDYFRVEDEQGRRYWLYRQGLYGASKEMPRWFMHGIFA
ncbi:DNA polymerase Y family protein [Aquamicrobium sp. LC103]|uniref:DNA polymerase Y family protein n=1 Tax=Aquamicrobium sp. LC103 TaxID=1120658 RepID=UPI001FEDA14A|nr:DNA polymerase Y family protein [Aquamicrobium sp. LC103]